MRPAAQPALIPGEFCAPCPLPCAEKDTGAACTSGGGARYGVHPAHPDVFWQWLDWASEPEAVAAVRPLPPLPAHIAVMKKEITAADVRELPSTVIGFTITEYLAVASRAERAGITAREYLGASGRRIVVIGADEDRVNVGRWQDWGSVRERLVRHAPDLVVGPDLSIYDDEEPAPAIVHFFTHTKMHASLVADGLCSLPAFGYTRASDIERFAAWACDQRIPGAFLDLQNRKEPKILEIADDLRRYRHLFPSSFTWLVNGCGQPKLWREFHDALGVTIFSGLGAWEEARLGNRLVARDDALVPEPTDAPFVARLAANVETLRIAASRVVLAPVRPRRSAEQIELPLFETTDQPRYGVRQRRRRVTVE